MGNSAVLDMFPECFLPSVSCLLETSADLAVLLFADVPALPALVTCRLAVLCLLAFSTAAELPFLVCDPAELPKAACLLVA